MAEIEVDASILEGGGQIFRISLCLSTLLKVSCRLHSIRNNRPNPGLAKQHLTVTYIFESLGIGNFEGNVLGSSIIRYTPRNHHVAAINDDIQRIEKDVGSAGSISLILQAILPLLIFQPHPTLLTLKGGTNVSFSPPIDHVHHVLLPLLSKMGVRAQLFPDFKRGYYPFGGGKVQFMIDGDPILRPIVLLNQGEIESIYCYIYGDNDLEESQLSLKSHLEEAIMEYLQSRIPTITGSLSPVVGDTTSSTSTSSTPILTTSDVNVLENEGREGEGEGEGRGEGHQHILSLHGFQGIHFQLSSATVSSSHSSINNSSEKKHYNKKGDQNKQTKQQQSNSQNKRKKNSTSNLGAQLVILTSTGNIFSANYLICEKNEEIFQTSPQTITIELLNQIRNIIESGGCIDEHTADQLLIYMALAGSDGDEKKSDSDTSSLSESKILCEPFVEGRSSQHLETSIYLLNQLLGSRGCHIHLETDTSTGCRLITCRGIGYTSLFL